jgi:hypothetical protein
MLPLIFPDQKPEAKSHWRRSSDVVTEQTLARASRLYGPSEYVEGYKGAAKAAVPAKYATARLASPHHHQRERSAFLGKD